MNNQNSEQHNSLFVQICHCIIFAIVAFSCAYLWNTFFAGSSVPATIAPTSKVTTVQNVKPKYKHTRIADIKVGERVVASTDDTPQPTAVDSATWKKVTLYAEETWYDGTIDSINVVTLVPPEWIALYDAKVESLVPIPLDVQEMGLDENLLAKIQAIERYPEIRAGPGRVVLTTINHLSRGICNLTYINHAGQSETIRPTSSHRFYSLDRKDWIHIGNARFGEKLQGLGNDVITVISCQSLGTIERVYNMTVEDEHVYHVGKLNLLTHNTECILKLTDQETLKQALEVKGILAQKVSPSQLAGSRAFRIGGSTGHARGRHGVSNESCAEIMNNAERCFIGVYEKSGRHVNVFYRDGSVVITDGLDPCRVITAYGKVSGDAPIDPSKFVNSAYHNEIIWK
jgi:hypothetical protein